MRRGENSSLTRGDRAYFRKDFPCTLAQGGFLLVHQKQPPHAETQSLSWGSAHPSLVTRAPHSLSQTGQHFPGILPGCLQGVGGQGRGSQWTLPFCQKDLVSR